MPRTTVDYEVGRVNFIHTFDHVGRDQIETGLGGDQTIEVYGNLWRFLSVEKVLLDGAAYFVGYLVKFRSSVDEEVVDTAQSRLTKEAVANAVLAKSRFALNSYSHLIAFHPVGQDITRTIFVDRFKKLFEGNYKQFMLQVDIQMVQDEALALETLSRFSQVGDVEFTLRPSNPSSRDVFKGIDDRLRRLGVYKYYEKMRFEPRSQNFTIAADEEIRAKVAMAAAGYGEATIQGVINGEEKELSTNADPLTATVPTGDEVTSEEVARSVHHLFETVLGKDQ